MKHFAKEGAMKISIDGWKDDQPEESVIEKVNEFVVIARSGENLTFKGSCSTFHLHAAMKKIKEALLSALLSD